MKTTSLYFILSFIAIIYVAAQTAQAVDLNQIFTISVRGSFRQDIPGFPCEDCDCTETDPPSPCSTWFDGVTCIDSNPDPDDNQQRWGADASGGSGCECFCQSGVGFAGITDVPIQANSPNSTRIGRMTHYNNVITGNSPTKLQLFINMSAPELADNFETIFPLSFIETPNHSPVSSCDPSIQRTNTPCDDRFSFDAYVITKSFLSNNVRYTLQITGFIQEGGTEPIAQFVTKEAAATTANVFAKIVTFCEEADCGPNEQFEAAPLCACQCVLTNKTCNAVFGPLIAVDEEECTCACASDGSECNATNPDIGAFNEDTCSCGCNVTNDYCSSINPLYEASLLPGVCACLCNRQRFIECRTENLFFFPTGDDCVCTCGVTDDLCKDVFGNKYRANRDKCGCFVPGEDTGLTDEEIAGIVVASVVGPLLIIAFILILAAVLAYLILAGYMPGIYGHKIAQGSFAAGGISGLYKDKWTTNSNAMA